MATCELQHNRRPATLSQSQRQTLERFGRRVNRLGANFAVCSHHGDILLLCQDAGFRSARHRLVELSRRMLTRENGEINSDSVTAPVRCFSGPNTILAGILPLEYGSPGSAAESMVALIDLGDGTARTGIPATQRPLIQEHRTYLMEMLALLIECFEAVVKAGREMDHIGNELAKVYEELVLLHRLNNNMKVTETHTNFLQTVCDSLVDVIVVQGTALVLERLGKCEPTLKVVAQSGIIHLNPSLLAMLADRLKTEMDNGREVLVDSTDGDACHFDWPTGIKNIVAVPLLGKDSADTHFIHSEECENHMIGMMVAINRKGKKDFDSTNIKLLNSVANSCAVFIENERLFNDLSDLFIGSLKALTDSIDAKDGYTHGHSERVAIIARWIAERLVETGALHPDQVHEIYLAGLLHDIGKIGVDDSVLRKAGPLTGRERELIQKHPLIGAGILKGIKQMHGIVPGVLCHHERVDGKGYPQGLRTDQIPLTGKIIGLADSFDAMTSRRSYRDEKRIEDAIQEIERCTNTQFDAEVARVFLESDIQRLWQIMKYSGGRSSFPDEARKTLLGTETPEVVFP